MKKTTLMVVIALFALLSTSCSTDSVEENTISQTIQEDLFIPASKTIEIEIMELINDHRLNLGLNSLRPMSIIKGTAHSHTGYMIQNSQMSHDNFSLRRSYLMNNANAITVSENVGYGYDSANSIVQAWINSEGHRRAIEGNFTDFEVSAEQNESGTWYFTNIFIKK